MITQFKSNNINKTSNSSLLICVFNNAKDNKLKNAGYNFTRLNSSILSVNDNICSLVALHNKVLTNTTTNNFYTLGLANLNVYYIVHPDTISQFMSVTNVLDGYKLLKNRMYTYEDFFKLVVGGYGSEINNELTHKNFLNCLSNSIFIFEDTSWFVLALKFRYSSFILSGGSNTKKHFLSSLEFRLSQFILAVYTMNQINVFDKLLQATKDPEIQFDPLKVMHKAARSINKQTLKIIFESYNFEILDANETKQILEILTTNKLPGLLNKTFLQIVRDKPGYNLFTKDLVGEPVKISFIKTDSNNSLQKCKNNNVPVGKGIKGNSSRKFHTSAVKSLHCSPIKLSVPNHFRVSFGSLNPFYSQYSSNNLYHATNKIKYSNYNSLTFNRSFNKNNINKSIPFLAFFKKLPNFIGKIVIVICITSLIKYLLDINSINLMDIYYIKIFLIFGILISSILALDYLIKIFIYLFFKENNKTVISDKLPKIIFNYLNNLKILSEINNFDYNFFKINFFIYLFVLLLLITIFILLVV